MVRTGYKKSGFMKIEKHSKPFYLKTKRNEFLPVDIKDWDLQYSEGDKAYRDL